MFDHTWWERCCLCWHSCRRRRGRPRGRRLSPAAADQERRVLHADSAKVKDSQCQRPAAPAHPQVLHQRALLQPQGGLKRVLVLCNQFSWRCCTCRCAGTGVSCSRLTVQSQDELVHQPLQCVLAFSRFQLEGFPYSFLFKTFKVFQEPLKWKRSSTFCPLCCRCVDVYFSFPQTSVFTPAYGSVTNVRVNSSMTTEKVLNLLLHKFRVNRHAH